MRTRFFVLSSIASLLAVAGVLTFALPRQAEAEQCENASIVDLYANGFWAGIEDPGFMKLGWSLDIDPWPEDFYPEEEVYSIHRRPANSETWELVTTVENRTVWEGAPQPGRWVYYVSLVSLRADGDTEKCSNVGAETTFDLPTEAELAPELLGLLCERSEVVHLEIVRPDDGSLMLKWDDSLDHFYEWVDDDFRDWDWDVTTFKADTVVYRVQRSTIAQDGTSSNWVALAETTDRTWNGPAEPGHWAYRVDTIRMTKGSVAVDCETWYDEEHLRIQTAEEIARQAQQKLILKAEATRCANATLTSSLQGEARQIIADMVTQRVAEIFTTTKDENRPDEAFYSLVTLTVLLCTEEGPPMGYGFGTSPSWTALELLGLAHL